MYISESHVHDQPWTDFPWYTSPCLVPLVTYLSTLLGLWTRLPCHIQAWGDGVQVLAWPGTGLSVWAVYTGRSSCWTTASSLRQPPSTRFSTVSARYVRPSQLRCRWTNDLELVRKQFEWAGHANWLFSSYTEDVSFWSVLGTCDIERIKGAFCDDALLTLTLTFTIFQLFDAEEYRDLE